MEMGRRSNERSGLGAAFFSLQGQLTSIHLLFPACLSSFLWWSIFKHVCGVFNSLCDTLFLEVLLGSFPSWLCQVFLVVSCPWQNLSDLSSIQPFENPRPRAHTRVYAGVSCQCLHVVGGLCLLPEPPLHSTGPVANLGVSKLPSPRGPRGDGSRCSEASACWKRGPGISPCLPTAGGSRQAGHPVF